MFNHIAGIEISYWYFYLLHYIHFYQMSLSIHSTTQNWIKIFSLLFMTLDSLQSRKFRIRRIFETSFSFLNLFSKKLIPQIHFHIHKIFMKTLYACNNLLNKDSRVSNSWTWVILQLLRHFKSDWSIFNLEVSPVFKLLRKNI